MISPVFETPLLLVERDIRVLVASDLHLGLEFELWLCGMSIPSQTERLLGKLKDYLNDIKPDHLVLLGDIKHNVPRTSWQEKQEVPNFLKALSSETMVEIVLGNHDVGLADMAPLGVKVHDSSGFVLDGVGYFHGHTWPDQKLFESDALVAGHIHPAVRLRDPLGCALTRPAWIRANLLPHILESHYGRKVSALEMILVPAFNALCGGLPLNQPSEEERGPILALADLDQARVYLLDGTNLGRLGEIKDYDGNPEQERLYPETGRSRRRRHEVE
ncbi:MAG: metallophosphoesterase [Methanotrichaceae archaeon]|nr:metallophosphoesterase [Methanotrichaceae archaeon]